MSKYSKWKVLIVEDEVDAQEVMKTLLEQYSMVVIAASTAEEALDSIKKETPTVAIIDLALPGMDGWQLLETIKANPISAGIPAIAMTAYHSTTVAQEAITAGFTAYFPKPINARTFVKDLISSVQ